MSRKSSSTSGQQPLRLLEAGVTLFRPAEIQVVRRAPCNHTAGSPRLQRAPIGHRCVHVQVIVPVGQVPPELWLQYCSLVTKHRLIELQLLRSFYKEQQKEPTHAPAMEGWRPALQIPTGMLALPITAAPCPACRKGG